MNLMLAKVDIFFRQGMRALIVGLFFSIVPIQAGATPPSAGQADHDVAVMQQFVEPQAGSETQRVSDKSRHRILFFMGFALLIFILLTAGLGVAMVIYKKTVFAAHMLFAGLSVTLAIAHAVAAVVWFFPF
ncbi:MAG: hypothetical protein D6698_14750 [Gammaproteobacteria bacterium]|nr:MAG: hypothetical protein D6698_14750 [Gammaproteobacteria bacterium]